MNIEPDANIEPVKSAQISSEPPQNQILPDWLLPIKGDTLTSYFERLISFLTAGDIDSIKAMKGIFSGTSGVNFDVPAWVKRASLNALQSNGMECALDFSFSAEFKDNLEQLGKITRLLEFITSEPLPVDSHLNEDHVKGIAPLADHLKILASKSSPEESAAFFNARNESVNNIEKLRQLSIKSKIYTLMAAQWHEIEKLKETGEIKSTSDLSRWLLENRNTRIVLPIGTDSREVRKACKTVGLEFKNQWRKKEK